MKRTLRLLAALLLAPLSALHAADAWGRMKRNLYRDNIFERCGAVLSEGSRKSWDAANASGNVFSSCGQVPADK